MSRLTCGHIQHMYSWWWVRLSPETFRVKPLRIKNAIVASCWTYFTTICYVLCFTLWMDHYPFWESEGSHRDLCAYLKEERLSFSTITCFSVLVNTVNMILERTVLVRLVREKLRQKNIKFLNWGIRIHETYKITWLWLTKLFTF